MISRPSLALIVLVAACSSRTSGPGAPAPVSAGPGPEREGSLVTLERTPCYGECPVYQVSIAGDGAVEFAGKRFVAHLGLATAKVSSERVDSLLRALETGGYFGFADLYVAGSPACGYYAADAPTVITSVTAGGRTKTIRHDYGCAGAPAALIRLERLIDEVAGTGRWTGR
jgi:hypothetical protein